MSSQNLSLVKSMPQIPNFSQTNSENTLALKMLTY